MIYFFSSTPHFVKCHFRRLQFEREEWTRQSENKDKEISGLKDSSQGLLQRLQILDNKLTTIENEVRIKAEPVSWKIVWQTFWVGREISSLLRKNILILLPRGICFNKYRVIFSAVLLKTSISYSNRITGNVNRCMFKGKSEILLLKWWKHLKILCKIDIICMVT